MFHTVLWSLLGCVWIVFAGLVIATRSPTNRVLTFTLSTAAFLLGVAFLFLAGYNLGERRGCIDAENGKPAYILTTQPDSSVEWVLTRKN